MGEAKMKSKTEAINWIRNFLNDIDAQDNRCTAKPIIFLLQTKSEYVAHPQYYGSGARTVYRHPMMEENSLDSVSEVKKWVNEFFEGRTDKQLQDEYEKIEELQIGHHWDTQEVCFTEKGIQRHLALNKHNYRDCRDFVIHAFRNPEISELFEALRLIVSNVENEE